MRFSGHPLRFCLLLLLPAVSMAEVPPSAFDADPYPRQSGPLHVFILAGQSNMQGQASLRNLEYLIYNKETADQYEHLKDMKGDWVRRNDVWVWTTDGERSGSLQPGYGANPWKFGPELGFGWTVGKHLDRQVLLIKTCWGGKSVRRDFLPPGAERPSDQQLDEDLEGARRNAPNTTREQIQATYGAYYAQMIQHVRDVLNHLEDHFPGYDANQGYELAGLVWFQGWNDMVDGQQRAEQYAGYTNRLAQLIRDVRQDLQAPGLPVIIGELGVGGADAQQDFRHAQKAVAAIPEFQGTVQSIETHSFWEPEVEQMVQDEIWKGPDWPRFYNVGSDRGYHYLGSGKIMYQMGQSFGQGMVDLLKK